ncbi:MAG: NADH-quinone oxidoreductase subunit NuoN, partial [Myxococcota bacterium]|nr:NADH-quinone oxidoreductase subunit NuoN [Myxococcota bacterium]
VLRQDYMRTAYAKGLSEYMVVTRHALKNAMIPVVTLIGLEIPWLLGSLVVIEQVFTIPGLGRLMLDSITQRDFPMIQGLAIFLGLELMSIPIYALAGFDRRKLRSNESAMKYFLIGSFASAVLLYGVALLYGTTGSTSLLVLRSGFDPSSPLAVIGIALVLVGFAFKISAVPFHQWTPDVYEGAPSSVTAFMSVTVKTAAVAALLRVLGLGLGPLEEMLVNVLWVLAVLTMVVGNLMAVIQDNVKRLLAYSSIGHAGYILVGIVAGGVEGWSAVVFYLIAYLFMNLGAFGVVVALANRGEDCERVDSFAGLARTRPGLAALMTLFMVALTGIPPTVGFFAKFGIFLAAVNAGFVGLAIIGVLMSAVSVYYYLRIPVLMYMREPEEQAPRLETSSGEIFVLGLCAIAVLFLGIFPNGGELPVVDWARTSVSVLFD